MKSRIIKWLIISVVNSFLVATYIEFIFIKVKEYIIEESLGLTLVDEIQIIAMLTIFVHVVKGFVYLHKLEWNL